jgi:hypothetical protein
MSKAHDSDHGHAHDDGHGHEAGVPFVPETSLYDRALSLVTVLVAVGLIWLGVKWFSLPLPTTEGTPAAETGAHEHP